MRGAAHYLRRRTAVLILRPECCPGVATLKELLVDPILKVGVWLKEKPPLGAAGCAGFEGVGVAAAVPPGVAPNANTAGLLPAAPKALGAPNWKPPPGAEDEEAAVEPNVGAALAGGPNEEAGCTPKAGVWEAGAEKREGAPEPKAGALGWLEPWPKAGVEPEPNAGGAEAAVAEPNTNGAAEDAAELAVEGAAAPKLKEGAAVVLLEPNRKGWPEAGAGAVLCGTAGWGLLSACCPNMKVFAGGPSAGAACPNTKVLAGAGGVELAGAVPDPNRLGAGAAEEEELADPAMNPKAGLAAPASPTAAPKLKDGLGVSAASVFSADFPKANTGFGSSLGGSDLLKENPAVGAGFSASFAPLNRKEGGALVSGFASAFPNEKVGAGVEAAGAVLTGSAGSSSAGLPNVKPLSGWPAGSLVSGIFPKEKAGADTVSVEEGPGAASVSGLSLGVENTNPAAGSAGAAVAAASSGFGRAAVDAVSAGSIPCEFSELFPLALVPIPVPNTIVPQVPNLKPDSIVFLSSPPFEEPGLNLKPAVTPPDDEDPNLNPP